MHLIISFMNDIVLINLFAEYLKRILPYDYYSSSYLAFIKFTLFYFPVYLSIEV